jgi:hypothetical protein
MRRFAALSVVVAALLAGCGGDDDDEQATDGADTTTSTTGTPEEATTTAVASTMETIPPGPDNPVSVLEGLLVDTMRWQDAEINGTGVQAVFDVSSPTHGEATATLEKNADGYYVQEFDTIGDPELGASVSFGNDSDSVAVFFEDPVLTPQLIVAYGDGFSHGFLDDKLAVGEPASWSGFELDAEADLGPRIITVLWLDADGVAAEAWVREIPAGPFAAG